MAEHDVYATHEPTDTTSEQVFAVCQAGQRIGMIMTRSGPVPRGVLDIVDPAVLGVEFAWQVDKLPVDVSLATPLRVARLAIAVAQTLTQEGHPWTSVISDQHDRELDEAGMQSVGGLTVGVRIALGPIGIVRDDQGAIRLAGSRQGSSNLHRK